jgi:GGDEF domain-containing protein
MEIRIQIGRCIELSVGRCVLRDVLRDVGRCGEDEIKLIGPVYEGRNKWQVCEREREREGERERETERERDSLSLSLSITLALCHLSHSLTHKEWVSGGWM